MPKLGVKNLQTIYMPSTAAEPDPEKKAWVKVNTAITIADVGAVEQYESQTDQSAYVLSQLVQEWNYENEENTDIAPITIETVKKLPLQDFNFLADYLKSQTEKQTQGVATPLKEASTSTSSNSASPAPAQ